MFGNTGIHAAYLVLVITPRFIITPSQLAIHIHTFSLFSPIIVYKCLATAASSEDTELNVKAQSLATSGSRTGLVGTLICAVGCQHWLAIHALNEWIPSFIRLVCCQQVFLFGRCQPHLYARAHQVANLLGGGACYHIFWGWLPS